MNSNDNTWEAEFSLTAFAPVLSVNSISIENDDNGNGILDPLSLLSSASLFLRTDADGGQ